MREKILSFFSQASENSVVSEVYAGTRCVCEAAAKVAVGSSVILVAGALTKHYGFIDYLTGANNYYNFEDKEGPYAIMRNEEDASQAFYVVVCGGENSLPLEIKSVLDDGGYAASSQLDELEIARKEFGCESA